jgi:carbamate kinase
MLVIVALGGNALTRRGESADAEAKRRNIVLAVDVIARLAEFHRIVVTLGNGTQVGLLTPEPRPDPQVAPSPRDVVGAESEVMIGYLLEQGLGNRLAGTATATLLTQVVVDERDPVSRHPSKPVGPTYDRKTAERLARERHWTVAPDGKHWRRVVPSLEPQRIVELQTILTLVNAGVLVVCAGGGGVPVTVDDHGALHGVEGVIDGDRLAGLLARELDADALLLLTDVPHVERNHATRLAHPIHEASTRELDPAEFSGGSMRPKIEAACRFAADTGRIAGIGALSDAAAILAGQAGTRIFSESIEAPVTANEHAFDRLDARMEDVGRDVRIAMRLSPHSVKPLPKHQPRRAPGAGGITP